MKTYVVYLIATGAILRRIVCHPSQAACQVTDPATEAIMLAPADALDTTHRVVDGQVVPLP